MERTDDEDGLSDYARQQKKLTSKKNANDAGDDGSQEIKVTVTVDDAASFADLETASRSLPESRRSAEDFTLSRYVEPAAASELPASAASRVLVDDSDITASKTTDTQSLSQSIPQPGPSQPTLAKRSRSPDLAPHKRQSRQKVDAAISAEAHADDEDEDSQQRSKKRTRTSPPSTFSFFNPMNYFRSDSRSLATKEEMARTPVEEARKSTSDTRSDGPTLESAWKSWIGLGTNELRKERDDGVSKGQTSPPKPKAELSSLRSLSRDSHVRHTSSSNRSPSSALEDRRIYFPALGPIALHTTVEPLEQDMAAPRTSDKRPLMPRPKLGGFKLDLVPLGGLSEKWVLGMTRVAEDYRRAKAARGRMG